MGRRIILLILPCVLAFYGCDRLNTTGSKETSGGDASSTKADISSENAKVEFVGTKPKGKHDGGFKKFSGSIDLDSGKIVLDIDTTSLWSDNPKLTQHLKSPDFFDVKNHATAKFESTKIVVDKGEGKTHSVTGKLTLLGKTKEITLPINAGSKDGKLVLTSSFEIDRNDFGMTYGKGKVDPKVKISVSVNSGG